MLPPAMRGAELATIAANMQTALQPATHERRTKRLTRMGLAFGHERDADRAKMWLEETARLLADLPDDILGHAIDSAVKASERGFLPAVGQIRAFADPMLRDRREQAGRLAAMVAMASRPAGPTLPAPAPADDGPACDPADVARMNKVMRRLGCRTRYRADGTDYQLAADDADPADDATAIDAAA
ncbi:hypothetical protein ACVOMT_16630 [Sphingomonas panni]